MPLLLFTHPTLIFQQLSPNHPRVHSIPSSTLITTPPFRLAQSALRALRFPACLPRHPSCPSLAQAILFRARGGGRSQPHILIKQPSSSLAVLIPVSLSRGGRGCPRWRSCAGKAPLYTSFLAHWLTSDFVAMSSPWTVSGNVTARCLGNRL